MNYKNIHLMVIVIIFISSNLLANNSKFLVNVLNKHVEFKNLATIENNIVECAPLSCLEKIPESEIKLKKLQASGFVKSTLISADICSKNSKKLTEAFKNYIPVFKGTNIYSNLAKNIPHNSVLFALKNSLTELMREIAWKQNQLECFPLAFFMALSFIDPTNEISLKKDQSYNFNDSQQLARIIKILIKLTLKKRQITNFNDFDLIVCVIGEVYALINSIVS